MARDLSSLGRIYRGKWNVSDVDTLSEESINNVKSATVVASEYGNSVCMMLYSGGMQFLPVSTDSKSVKIGDSVNLKNCDIITLSREGDDDIYRIRIK